MSTNVRVMPPGEGSTGSVTTKVNGRSYTCALGSTIDVPDFDANVLLANGWVHTAGGAPSVCSTAQRPTGVSKGHSVLDSTLGKVVTYDGKVWRDPVSGAQA